MTTQERLREERRSMRPRPVNARKLALARKECPYCWVVGGHDARCKRARVAAEVTP